MAQHWTVPSRRRSRASRNSCLITSSYLDASHYYAGVQGDVSNVADLDRLYDTVKQQKGRIDVLFANAGIIELAPLGSITESHFDKIFNINVKGLLFTVQKALTLFQDGGSIILTGSIGGSKGYEVMR